MQLCGQADFPVPVMNVAGLPGAGRTALVNRILSSDHSRRIAVVTNDFGSISINAGLVTAARENDDQARSGSAKRKDAENLPRPLHEPCNYDHQSDFETRTHTSDQPWGDGPRQTKLVFMACRGICNMPAIKRALEQRQAQDAVHAW